MLYGTKGSRLRQILLTVINPSNTYYYDSGRSGSFVLLHKASQLSEFFFLSLRLENEYFIQD
jgi:hypothetical protein